MPSFRITTTRVSVMTVDASSKKEAEALAKQLRMATAGHPLFGVLEQTKLLPVTTAIDAIETAEPARWVVFGGKLDLKPRRVASPAELELIEGDHQNDIALVTNPKTGAVANAYIFLRGVVVEPKKNLLGVFVPHLVFDGESICEFDVQSMVVNKSGVWLTQAMMQQVAKLLQSKQG
jgi:hypothetical protein